jgi:ABC-2 type transport system ATP-binding protein
MTDLISVRDLHKSFGTNPAVGGVSFRIQSGEIYGLVGADGAGKTTTIRLLCGALTPDQGEIQVAGYDIRHQVEQARSHIGYLSQRFSLYEDLTVLENIRFFAEVRGLKSDSWYPRCMEILEFVGLAEYKDRFAGKLSGGMKQKLGLATALVVEPKVFLFDEPTTGVDPVTRQDFWQLIIRLVDSRKRNGEEGVGVLVSTPYMDEAPRCHRIGFMRHGKLIAEGTPGELRALLTDRVIEVRGGPIPLIKEAARQIEQIDDIHTFGESIHIRTKTAGTQAVIQQLEQAIPAAGGKLSLARPIPPVLEDVFIALSKTEADTH